VGAEYEVQFAADSTGALQACLYSVTAAGVTTLLNGGVPLASGFSSNRESVELAIPQALLTPTGGTAPTAINFDVLLNGSSGLPSDFTSPQYIIPDPSAATPTTIAGAITLDGTFTDWPAADPVMTPGNTVAGYQIYGALLDDTNDATNPGETYVIGVDATDSTDPAIGAGTVIYLNTDQNTATGYSPFGAIGAEYEVVFQYGPNSEMEPFLYSVTSAGVTTELNNGQPLNFGFSSNAESVELAVPQTLLTPAGGTAPTSINFAALVNNGAAALPGDFSSDPEYTITDPATLVPVDQPGGNPRHLDLRPARGARTDDLDRAARQARHDRLGQRNRVHIERRTRLGAGQQGLLAFHCAGKAYAGRLLRELQWPHARRPSQ
jgi:hypothetical protein